MFLYVNAQKLKKKLLRRGVKTQCEHSRQQNDGNIHVAVISTAKYREWRYSVPFKMRHALYFHRLWWRRSEFVFGHTMT